VDWVLLLGNLSTTTAVIVIWLQIRGQAATQMWLMYYVTVFYVKNVSPTLRLGVSLEALKGILDTETVRVVSGVGSDQKSALAAVQRACSMTKWLHVAAGVAIAVNVASIIVAAIWR